MLRLLTLVVCLLTGCALQEPPTPPAPPGPDDLSTWGTTEMVAEPPGLSRKRPPVQADHKPTPAEKVYPYVPGGTYVAPVGLGAPLDIQFQPGEQVHNAVDGDQRPLQEGETAAGQETCQRWCLKLGKSGAGETTRGHIFITVTEPGLKNGLTITTTRGVYAVTLESVKSSPVRFLRWTYQPEPVEVVDLEPMPLGPLPDTAKPSRWRVGYKVQAQGRQPDWMPQGAWDDGKKIYVLLPRTSFYGSSPLVRKIGPNGPQVINGRQYKNVLVVDELAGVLELRIGIGETAEVVRITRGNLRIIECPGEQACPVFPSPAMGGQS